MGTVEFADDDPAVASLYTDLATGDLQPLWRLHDLLASPPPRRCRPHHWPGAALRALGERAGELIGFDRGGDRRVLALCNPGLGGAPYATSTLWAAVQYLGGGETAPAHRHSPAALRFVLAGTGVVTHVDAAPLAMDAGDLVLTPSWTWHEHHNPTTEAMLWLDVLDLPLVEALDAVYFTPGTDDARGASPGLPPSEVWALGPGLAPATDGWSLPYSPIMRYPWCHTDEALQAAAKPGDGHAVVRFTGPVDGGDVMPTMRCEMHRIVGSSSVARRTGSSVWTVFRGRGTAHVGDEDFALEDGDIFVVPSSVEATITAAPSLDLFAVSDEPVLERLGLADPRFLSTHPEAFQ